MSSASGSPDPKYFSLYGEELQRAIDSCRGAAFSATTMGEVLPRFENYVQSIRT
jgi:hypothetical protein